MGCPKTNPNYPVTATRREIQLLDLVRRADDGFDKAHRYDPSYKYGRRQFVEDTLFHGAYGLAPALANDPSLVYGAQDGAYVVAPFDDGFSTGFQGANAHATYLAELDAQFRLDNGFCDTVDDGTVQTGTGAGGRNPGTVSSLAALVTQQDGFIIKTEDGRALRPEQLQAIGAVFYGGEPPDYAGVDLVTQDGMTIAAEDDTLFNALPRVALPSGLAED